MQFEKLSYFRELKLELSCNTVTYWSLTTHDGFCNIRVCRNRKSGCFFVNVGYLPRRFFSIDKFYLCAVSSFDEACSVASSVLADAFNRSSCLRKI